MFPASPHMLVVCSYGPARGNKAETPRETKHDEQRIGKDLSTTCLTGEVQLFPFRDSATTNRTSLTTTQRGDDGLRHSEESRGPPVREPALAALGYAPAASEMLSACMAATQRPQ